MNDRCPRAAESAQSCTLTSAAALAIPHKGSWMFIPASYGLLQPVNDVLGRLGMLSSESAAHNDALQRLGHIEPGTGKRRVQRQNAMLQQPANHIIAQVSLEIVPDQDEAQGRSRFGTFVG